RLPSRNLSCGNQITKRPKVSFELTARFLDHLSIESDAGELNKKFSVRLRQIHGPRAVAFNNLPAKLEIVNRQTKFGRENIHGANRQEAESDVAAGQAVHDFVDGAVTASGHDFLETLFDSASRHLFAFSGAGRRADNAILGERFNLRAFSLGALAVCGRIQNNEGVTHPSAVPVSSFLQTCLA